MNPISPDRLTAAERLDELAAILAAGVRRLTARQSRQHSHELGESSVDFTATSSRHDAARETAEERA